MNRQVSARAWGSERLMGYLKEHPLVNLDAFEIGDELRVEFRRDGWERSVSVGRPDAGGPYGLPELMDNNPLVCAGEACCPGRAATLAAVGLGPLVRAGLLIESPSVVFSFDGDYDEVDQVMAAMGSPDEVGVTSAGDPLELGGALAATCLAAIRVSSDGANEIQELYSESYGRSFFVRMAAAETMRPERVAGKPFALVSLTLGDTSDAIAILRVHVLADADGKAGSAQLVHMLNIMAGFEEDQGLWPDGSVP